MDELRDRLKHPDSLMNANVLNHVNKYEETQPSCCSFCSTLCWLCWSWPPCLCSPCCCLRKAANYLAMATPNAPSYNIFERSNKKRIQLLVSVLYPKEIEELADFVEIHEAQSAKKNLVCVYVRMFQKSPYTLLYSHGNACDVGNCVEFWLHLAKKTKCNIFGYDYRGYGRSTGKPKLSHMRADITAAWDKLVELGVPENEIVLSGFSLGTIATIELAASGRKPAGVVIAGGMATGLGALARLTEQLPTKCRVAHVDKLYFCDPVKSIDLVRRISVPTLIAHGTRDEIISFANGQALFSALSERVRVSPFWLACGHDIESHRPFLTRLKQFLYQELPRMNDPPRRLSEMPALQSDDDVKHKPRENSTRSPPPTTFDYDRFRDPFYVITSQPTSSFCQFVNV